MENRRSSIFKIMAVLLWVITLAAGLLDIYVFQFITISFYARFLMGNTTNATTMDIATSNTIRITTVLIMAVLYVIFLVATSEYHFKYLAQPRSWRLLGQSIVVELLIIITAFFVGPITW